MGSLLVVLLIAMVDAGAGVEQYEGAAKAVQKGKAGTAKGSGGDGPCPQPVLSQRAIVPAVESNQDQLNNVVKSGGAATHKNSAYDFKTIQAKGRHLFTTPFTEADGAGEGKRFANGEGPLGPREADFNSNLKLIQGKLNLPDSDFLKLLDIFQPPFSHIDSNQNVRFSILRLNGLDSQSCFECHNSIGSGHPEGDPIAEAFDRKPGTTGGPAGQASNAFINDTFPNPVMKFVRQPPHVFGTGYVIGLSEQITVDLIAQKIAAYKEAYDRATGKPLTPGGPAQPPVPGYEASKDLEIRDRENTLLMTFGTLRVRYIGDPAKAWDFDDLFDALTGDADTDLSAEFKEDDTGLEGVSRDLVVRPLQWKGIASNERNFVRSAMNFHFGLLPKELNPYYGKPQEQHDSDNDGVEDEVKEGEVSTLSIFTMSIRPPLRQLPSDSTLQAIVDRGEKLFKGEKVDDDTIVIGPANSCASCHVPELPLYDSKICVRDPRDDIGEALDKITTLVARQRSSRQLPIYKRLRAQIRQSKKDRPKALDLKEMKIEGQNPRARMEAVAQALKDALEPVGCPSSGYEFDLNMPVGSDFEALSFSYPRLPKETHDGAEVIRVPLFSDLKRHDMGEGLTDKFDQPTDVDAIKVARREFLTRPLWGVADTGPWLHDGRARTLRDAILMHASLGSEANPAIEQFKALGCDDQAAIVEFLLTLRLPVDCRYGPCFDHPADCHPDPAGSPGKADKK
jgi:hypothetical protein